MTKPVRRVAVFGATSDIAAAFARRCAEAGDRLVLIARDPNEMARLSADLLVRGAKQVVRIEADFSLGAALPETAIAAFEALGGLDIALIAYGSLPVQADLLTDPEAAEAALYLNFTSPALLSNLLANRFESAGAGTLAVITSVAGDRGRQSNYIYGAAKGGLQIFLEGLRHRLFPVGVNVLDIRPGFVATKMTEHLPKGGPLWATPEKVAADIAGAIEKRGAVLYTPWFWRGIMTVVGGLPRPLFHRSKL